MFFPFKPILLWFESLKSGENIEYNIIPKEINILLNAIYDRLFSN